MIKEVCAAFILVLIVSGCDRSPYPGTLLIAPDTYWKLHALGDGDRVPTDSDSVLMRIRVAWAADRPGSLFSTEQWYGVAGSPGLVPLFTRMRQGDSATVTMKSAAMPWAELGDSLAGVVPDTGWVQMELGLFAIRSLATSLAMRQERLDARSEADEQRILSEYLGRSNEKWRKSMEVLYVLDTAAGRGPKIQSGELVTLSYVARFLDDGKVFDDQRKEERSITFRLGDPDQVIKGLEVAAHLLPRNGGSGRFIIPSKLAFGPSGSSSGIVPPWTPVIYEIRVLPPVTAQAQAAR